MTCCEYLFFSGADEKQASRSSSLTVEDKNRLSTVSCFSLRTQKRSVARDIEFRAIVAFRGKFFPPSTLDFKQPFG